MPEIIQEGNLIGGDQAAGNIDKSVNIYAGLGTAPSSTIKCLIAQLKAETDADPKLVQFIEELKYYDQPFQGDVIGLEQKLKDGNQESLVRFALRCKELFYKKLLKNQFSETAQKINLHYLALVLSYFQNMVYPFIYKQQFSEAMIQTLLVDPIMASLDENPLNLTAEDINGMLYFLTGNCHITWTR